jgi:hypothetical protein
MLKPAHGAENDKETDSEIIHQSQVSVLPLETPLRYVKWCILCFEHYMPILDEIFVPTTPTYRLPEVDSDKINELIQSPIIRKHLP